MGANQYFKEAEDQKKYEEAFDLKTKQLDISAGNLALQKENLDLKKQAQEMDLIIKLYGTGGLGIGGSGSSNKSKAGSGKGNKHFAKRMKTEYPYIADGVLKTIMANTNLEPGSMEALFNYTVKQHEKYKDRLTEDGTIPEEYLGDLFNIYESVEKPWENFMALNEKFMKGMSEATQKKFASLRDYTVTSLNIPNVLDPDPVAELKDYETINKFVYPTVKTLYNTELNNINKNLNQLNKKDFLSDKEKILRSWLTERGGLLQAIDGFSEKNPQMLYETFGTVEAYKNISTSNIKGKAFPKESPLAIFNQQGVPVKVMSLDFAEYLRDIGVLRVGQRIEFITPQTINGQIYEGGNVPPPREE